MKKLVSFSAPETSYTKGVLLLMAYVLICYRQVLRHDIAGIIPITPEGGKVARVNAVSGAIESGNVYLPRNKPHHSRFSILPSAEVGLP